MRIKEKELMNHYLNLVVLTVSIKCFNHENITIDKT